MKILYLEDHAFFGDSIYEILVQDFPEHQIDYATSYAQAEARILNNKYDISLLDVILQNGKTGIHFTEKYNMDLGKILFITGCKDELTLKALAKYTYTGKNITVYETIKDFIKANEKK
jgi:response regulator of citrate/malate metabolism